MTEPAKKRLRKKRRVVGTATPPRVSFTLRIEQDLFDELGQLVKTFKGSRNEYIIDLISKDIEHFKRFRMLNIPVSPLPTDLK